MRIRLPATMICAALFAGAACAADAPSPFKPGPVFDFASVAAVPDADDLPGKTTRYKILFDVSEGAEKEELNRSFDAAARFINMNVAAGVPIENIKVAIVVHGPAAWGVTNDTVFAAHNDGRKNGSAKAVAAMIAKGVDFWICGQSAARQGIKKADLLPGVKLSLSAMVIDAQLQQQGYTLNPF